MQSNIYGTDSVLVTPTVIGNLEIPEANNCPICLIERDQWHRCHRCQKRVCIDCRNHDIKIHADFPTVMWQCCHCRHQQQLDGVEYEVFDYQKMDKATLAKMVLLYKKKLCVDYDTDSSSD